MKIKTCKLRAANVFRGKGDPRPYINGIHINKDFIEATNGHCAVRMSSEVKTRIDVIVRFEGAIPKSAEKTKLSFDKNQSIAYHYDLHGNLLSVQLFNLLDGKFPDLENVIPKEKTKGEFPAVQPSYIAFMDKAFPSSRNKFVYVKPISYSENKVVQYEVGPSIISDEYGDPIILIMPSRE